MKKSTVLLIGFMALGNFCAAQSARPATDVQVNEEGLAAVKVKGLYHVYALPGANLSGYDKVMLEPVEVSFSKRWKPDPMGGPVTAAEIQTIRNGLAKIIR